MKNEVASQCTEKLIADSWQLLKTENLNQRSEKLIADSWELLKTENGIQTGRLIETICKMGVIRW